jgi:hypothetical protein
MVDVATGWTECLPLITRDGSLVVEAIKHVQSLFPWLFRGVDFSTRADPTVWAHRESGEGPKPVLP